MKHWIRCAVLSALALFLPAAATAQVWTLAPSQWAGFTDNTTKNAAALGYFQLTGGATATFRTWAGVSETEPTGGQYATAGPSAGYIVIADGQSIWPSSTADGTTFGGTGGSPATYTGVATMTMDLMFKVADLTAFTGTNDATIGELGIGTSLSPYRAQFKIVNHTGVNYKQRCGIKIYGVPTKTTSASLQNLTGFADANTQEPLLEFNKVYTVTLQVGAGGAGAGWYRIWVDKTLIVSNTAYYTNNTLGANGNSMGFTSSVGATGVEARVLPRGSVYNSTAWYNSLGRPTIASNVGTTRVWNTCFTPKDSSGGADITGYPFTITRVTGTPTLAATLFTSSSPTPARLRLVPTASAGDVLRLSSVDQLGSLESDSYGNQWVGWANEYVPTGSAVWGVRNTDDASSYAIAVNFKDGLVREGSTAGTGTVLFGLDPTKRYGVVFSGNINDATARITMINLTDEYRRAPLLQTARLTTAWPTGSKGVVSAVYTFGATVAEPSTMLAGRTWGLMVGDSFGTTYTAALGTITIHVTGATGTQTGTLTEAGSGATGTITGTSLSGGVGTITATITGTAPFQGGAALTASGGGTSTGSTQGFTLSGAMVTTRNNVGLHVAYGSELHFLPNGFRLGKPQSSSIPDVTYQWSIGRSGLRIEDMGNTLTALSQLRGVCEFAPCFAVNSGTGGNTTLAGDTSATKLAAWGLKARQLRDYALADQSNVLIWPSPAYNHTCVNQYGTVGMADFLAGTYSELCANSPTMGIIKGQFWTTNIFPRSFPYFAGGDQLHIGNDTEGGRLFISDLFGNPAVSGFGTSILTRVK
jgi:hypothetical protein